MASGQVFGSNLSAENMIGISSLAASPGPKSAIFLRRHSRVFTTCRKNIVLRVHILREFSKRRREQFEHAPFFCTFHDFSYSVSRLAFTKWVAMEGSTSCTKSHGMFGEWTLGNLNLVPFTEDSSL